MIGTGNCAGWKEVVLAIVAFERGADEAGVSEPSDVGAVCDARFWIGGVDVAVVARRGRAVPQYIGEKGCFRDLLCD